MNYLLNKNQKEAVEHFNGPMIVLAGPGSGKTTVITYRIKNLIENYFVLSSKILVITFTKSAASEMTQRFKNMNVLNSDKVTFSTFHSLFFKIIRYVYGYDIQSVMSDDVKKNIIRNLIREKNFNIDDEDEYINNFFNEISVMKNELLNIDEFVPINMLYDEFRVLYESYKSYKIKNKKIDFDDMAYMCYKILSKNSDILDIWRNKYNYILIDEFQDINKAQYECIKLISNPINNIFVVGDDDQSIYSFRGARPDFMLDFNKNFKNTKQIILDINYRSTDTIIKLSDKIIRNNNKRYDKNIKGTNKKGKIPILLKANDLIEESEMIADKIENFVKQGIPLNEIAVIYRTNMQGGNFARCFANRKIPYNLKDNILNIYEHFITKDILSYMKLSQDITRNDEVIKIINKPKRYISKEIISKAQNMNGAILKNLYNISSLKKYQEERIDELLSHIYQIRKRKPYEAIKYIRNIVPYDNYIEDYSQFRKTNLITLKEIANEITEIAKDKNTFEDFFDYINILSNKIKEDRKNSLNYSLDNAVTLSTMHSIKGLEFDIVFIPTVVEGVIPHEKSKTILEIEEERRLFYVGVTRARKRLYISEVNQRYDKKVKRSIFISELSILK